MDFNKIRSKVEFPKDWTEFWKALEVAYEEGKNDMIYKLQCCANCKHNDFGHKCSKGQSGECVDYSCWQIHDSDGVSM